MKPLHIQASEAIGKQYRRQHGEGTNKAMQTSVRTITNFIADKYGLEKLENLKPHMIDAYVAARIESHIGPEQLTKDATALRLIADGIGKKNIVPKLNSQLGIERQSRYNPKEANLEKLAKVRAALVERAGSGNPADRALVAAFDARSEYGLRANESFRTQVVVDKDGKLYMEVHGAKGGLVRVLEAKTDAQVRVAEQYRAIAKEIGNVRGKLIPSAMTAKAMYKHQSNQMERLGATKENRANMHIQRHAWAQREVANGSPRLTVSKDLGHGTDDRGRDVCAHYVK
jgi:hypothetical protein